MNVIKSDIKRAIWSPEFALTTFGMYIAIILGGLNSLTKAFKGEAIQSDFHSQVLLSALSSDIMLLVVPILCAITYTTSFIDDIKSGYIKQCLPRSGRAQYIKGKIVAAGLSGGMVLLCGILTIHIIFALIFMPMEPTPQLDIPQQSMLAEVLAKAIIFFLSGMLWSLIGLALSAMTMSKYVAYASPFIIYYILVIISTRYFKTIYCINPQEWLSPMNFWPGGNWGIMLFLLELITITALFSLIAMSRRIEHV
jgi:hypothetical protein